MGSDGGAGEAHVRASPLSPPPVLQQQQDQRPLAGDLAALRPQPSPAFPCGRTRDKPSSLLSLRVPTGAAGAVLNPLCRRG